ncbi:MAG TPA: DUF3443 domain-containing protein [Candidatus Acidoferrales bacterium]|jgi:hypothetical protein|nr:DUF3443 domain-containing protein [Candidatus Acidoferrales bacterium]
MRIAAPGRFAVAATLVVIGALASIWISGCSSSGSSSTTPASTPTPTPAPPSATPGSNVQAISVTTGPEAASGSLAINSAFTSVTVCVPGSTTQCQAISGVLVDTGSSGLRILSSALTISLPQQKDSNGNPIAECGEFIDSETWGPVQTADISIAGEKASSVPIQVIGSPGFSVPASCSNLGPIQDDLATLGMNGILGVGNFAQDCGEGCAASGASNVGFYYTCPSSGCVVTAQGISQQVSNPVSFFATDNNGVIVELPAVSGAETSVTGSLIFGIGTQSNNALGSATVYTIDPDTGSFTTTFKGQTLTDASFLDTGSNAIYFLDSSTTGLPTCTDLTFWYCPSGTQNLSAVTQGANGATTTINFEIGNADTLTANANDGVAAGLGGPSPGLFDWGLPFFYGRNVYTAIEGANTPGGSGPYWAY